MTLFNLIDERTLSQLTQGAAIRQFFRDAPLVTRGEPSDLVVLIKGLVRISRDDLIVDFVRAPAILAASCVLLQEPSAVTIASVRNSEAAFVDAAKFHALLGSSPQLAERLAAQLSRENHDLLTRMTELVTGDVEERLETLLNRLALRHGVPLNGGRFFALPVRRRDLARMIDASTETVSRTLAEWKRRGWTYSNRSGIWWGGRPSRAARSSERSSAQ
jgi:CRP-like cAMP-binding protein